MWWSRKEGPRSFCGRGVAVAFGVCVAVAPFAPSSSKSMMTVLDGGAASTLARSVHAFELCAEREVFRFKFRVGGSFVPPFVLATAAAAAATVTAG